MSLLRPGNSTLSPSGPVAILLCVYVCVYVHVLETDTPLAPDCPRAMAPGVTECGLVNNLRMKTSL